MFCAKCGKENPEGTKFCSSCGEPMRVINTEGVIPNVATANAASGGSAFVNKLKAVPLKFWIGGGVGLLAIIIAIVFLVISSSTIDFKKYVTVETKGYNGFGTATVKIDWDAIEKEHGGHIQFTNKAQNSYTAFLGLATPVSAAKSNIKVKVDKNKELSNGDVITYTFEVDDDLYEYVSGRFDFGEGKFTVNNLEQAETVNVFEGVEVQFSGTAPNGRASIKYNNAPYKSIGFKLDKNSGLKNGDVVTVSVSESNVESFARSKGKIPAEASKQFTVSGLTEGVTTFSNVSESALAKLKKEAEDKIAAASTNMSSDLTVANPTYVGYYFLTKKNAETSNALFLVYSVDVGHKEGKFETTKVYFPVRFLRVLKGDGDEYKYDTTLNITGSSRVGNYSTYGYVEGAEMFKNIVTANKDNYNYEVSEGLKQFGE